ncbi:MAG: sigma-70 family RNA polymerase sigma factor [Phycisphaerae bacterium]|nr:sigma-70 family RNA polymerase sigma factor [Phycisphaerae bacterium]
MQGGATQPQLLDEHQYLAIARGIARRLRRRYQWVPPDDLYSFALFGLVQAAGSYDPDRHVPFPVYAARKALFAAIDEMRKDHTLCRVGLNPRPNTVSLDKLLVGDQKDWWRLCDQTAQKARRRLEAREWCATMLSELNARDRRLIMLRYVDDMTFGEIGKVMGVSESTICLRHHALITRFRKLANKHRSDTVRKNATENTS